MAEWRVCPTLRASGYYLIILTNSPGSSSLLGLFFEVMMSSMPSVIQINHFSPEWPDTNPRRLFCLTQQI
jgi:hypothetical protein